MSFITGKHVARRTMLRGLGRHRGAAVPRRDGAGARPARRHGHRGLARPAAAGRASRWCTARPAAARGAPSSTCGRRWRPGRDFDLGPDLAQPARDLPQAPDHRQRHRRAQRRGVHAAGDRRRPLPLERGVPDPGAPAPDRELGRPRRRLARPDLRAEVRPGHADPVDAAVHRERRSGRRLRLRLLLRLHRHDQLGVADRAAADDPRPADGLRPAVRRRRLRRRAHRAAPGDGQRARLRDRRRSPT